MEIKLPPIAAQQRKILKESTSQGVAQLEANLDAPVFSPQTEIDESHYPRTHLLREREGWEPPHPDIVGAYFRHFQEYFPEYGTDEKLAALLGLSSNRRIREFKNGDRKVPYGIWRTFLVLTKVS